MLESHLNAIEAVLLAQSKAASNAGHPNLRGGPREWFIHNFLEDHLPSILEVGQGEIINADSKPQPKPGEYRPQVDIVLYRRDLPKISYAQRNTAFLQEGVVATIEVKTKLTREDLLQACKACSTHKALKYYYPDATRKVITHRYPLNILSYIVAFDGPARMSTIVNWLKWMEQKSEVKPAQLVEMIVVLGKGTFWQIASFPALKGIDLRLDSQKSYRGWAFVQQEDKNLLLLFVHMLSWMGTLFGPSSLLGYARRLSLTNVSVF